MTDRETRPADRLKKPVPRPPLTASLIFECINDCNLTCAYCYDVWNRNEDYPRGIPPHRRDEAVNSQGVASVLNGP